MADDPARFLSGVTANTAAAEDAVVMPGEACQNDDYTVDEGHRLLFEGISTGFWILAPGDTVRSIDQQYIP